MHRRRNSPITYLAALSALTAGGLLWAQQQPTPSAGAAGSAPGVVALNPGEMKWMPQAGAPQPGLEQAILVGDPAKPGPYTIRLRFPAGYKVPPHTHPDSREVTILSGTWFTGYGEKYDPAALKALPAGSFYTEPAGVAHFVEVKEPVLIQVSGMGPSGRRFVDAPAPAR